MDEKESTVEFAPPKGWQAPEGSETHGEFDMVCTFRVNPDGKLCLTKLGDTEMPGCDHKEDKPDYSELSKPIMASQLGSGESQDMKGY